MIKSFLRLHGDIGKAGVKNFGESQRILWLEWAKEIYGFFKFCESKGYFDKEHPS